MISLITARIRIRDDSGPTDQLGEPEEYIGYKGMYYPASRLTSAPGILPGSLVTTPGDSVMVHKISDGDGDCFVISSHHVWRPGAYDSERAAKYAARFTDEQLKSLQNHLNDTIDDPSKRLITFEMLQRVRHEVEPPSKQAEATKEAQAEETFGA